MKQRIQSFITTCYEDLKDLNNYLYNNPEESYKEYKACEKITGLLSKYGFSIENNYVNFETSFKASKGDGYPKICFLCEYDAIPNEGHLTGHNLLTTTSIAAALSLGEVIGEINGTVILIGCPGEYLGGTKSVMTKQEVFDDIDVVLTAHPDLSTCESGSSAAIIPLKVQFNGNSGLSFLNKGIYTSLDGILLTFNILNSMLKGFPKEVEISSILSEGGFTPLLLPLESEAKFYIRAKETELAKLAENKLREIVECVSKLIHVQSTISLYEPPNEELITNRTLNRLFSHNLKENGEIHIGEPKDVPSGLSIGSVSRKVPCIHPYFSIVTDSNAIRYGSKSFAEETISPYAFEQAMKAALALAYTGYDLITNEELLQEVKQDFLKELE